LLLCKIDSLTLNAHGYLRGGDHRCFYLREYTTRAGYGASETNQLIFNLKKDMNRRGRPEWKHKGRAIRQVIQELRDALTEKPGFLDEWLLVPMPPSKVKAHPGYDDRMVQVVRGICEGGVGRWSELLVARNSREPARGQERRPRPEDHEHNLRVDEECVPDSEPRRIAVVDDVLISGAGFVAAKGVLQRRFPEAEVVGVFVARAKYDPFPELDPIDPLDTDLM